MKVIIEYLPLMIAIAVIAFVCAVLVVRTKHALLFTLIQGATALFGFCFLMWAGASLEELLVMLAVMLLPSMLICDKRGREE